MSRDFHSAYYQINLFFVKNSLSLCIYLKYKLWIFSFDVCLDALFCDKITCRTMNGKLFYHRIRHLQYVDSNSIVLEKSKFVHEKSLKSPWISFLKKCGNHGINYLKCQCQNVSEILWILFFLIAQAFCWYMFFNRGLFIGSCQLWPPLLQ